MTDIQQPTAPQQDQEQVAIPYVPPPPPETPHSSLLQSSATRLGILVAVVALGGFMTYNFVGNQLTQTAGDSVSPASVEPAEDLTPSPSVEVTP